MNTNLEHEDLNGDEFLNLLINYQKDFPDVDKFDMIASGTIGDGLIKTINSSKEFFCQEKNCFYSVKIRVNQINEVVFLPSIFDNGSEIDVKRKLDLVEELEVKEVLYYKLKMENPHKQSVHFTISPRESDTVIYVNPDKPIEEYSKAQFITIGKGVQSIIITNEQMKYFNYSGEIFYLAF